MGDGVVEAIVYARSKRVNEPPRRLINATYCLKICRLRLDYRANTTKNRSADETDAPEAWDSGPASTAATETHNVYHSC